MKMNTYLCAAVVAAFCANGVATAAHQPGHLPRQARSGGEPPLTQSTGSAKFTSDDEPSIVWRTARYPGRVGHSVLRSPMIVGETVTGKRTFIGKRGFFQSAEAAEQAKSMPQGRGQRPSAPR